MKSPEITTLDEIVKIDQISTTRSVPDHDLSFNITIHDCCKVGLDLHYGRPIFEYLLEREGAYILRKSNRSNLQEFLVETSFQLL